MQIYPIVVILLLAVLNWISVDKKIKRLEYITKPAVMLALLWWFGVNVELGGQAIWFSLGLIFCLAGDIFLMLPRDMFIFGLLSFLLGHVCYIFGLNDQAPYTNWLGLITAVLLSVYMAWLYPSLVRGLNQKGKANLRIPVLIYALVISLMVYSAILTWSRPGWPDLAALSVSLGALSFYSSDSILAWDRFVRHLAHGRLITMVTYHLGQFGIILGAILLFIR
jgi:uncharacterized membrane protein YhhN